ncbi:hypothetical protein psal_cds_821 [Pandoravirus salinus]|uniref:Uncharacterized protein n=1 Tax=Pandoravirus salinus TaxID=1349410 RepID=S4VZC1_9VIRU|nr:hypothetical protein psal_cds_821 [Pandoravirus salinus]AGO84856.2 hypothetical protein psal_cds_821 [Pandoravirus salinus]
MTMPPSPDRREKQIAREPPKSRQALATLGKRLHKRLATRIKVFSLNSGHNSKHRGKLGDLAVVPSTSLARSLDRQVDPLPQVVRPFVGCNTLADAPEHAHFQGPNVFVPAMCWPTLGVVGPMPADARCWHKEQRAKSTSRGRDAITTGRPRPIADIALACATTVRRRIQCHLPAATLERQPHWPVVQKGQ